MPPLIDPLEAAGLLREMEANEAEAKAREDEINRRRSNPALPLLMLVKKKSAKLGFDVGKVGPSGLGGVDVFVTTDEGETWAKSAEVSSVTLSGKRMKLLFFTADMLWN